MLSSSFNPLDLRLCDVKMGACQRYRHAAYTDRIVFCRFFSERHSPEGVCGDYRKPKQSEREPGGLSPQLELPADFALLAEGIPPPARW
jgi:hypothetical protein